MRILLSGACGFVGSTLARAFAASGTGHQLCGLDNFSRPGSETNRAELARLGVKLFHGDLRVASDLENLPPCDWVIDAAANPSVLAGVDGKTSSRELVDHNLGGTVHILEYCKAHKAGFILLSTSRVYPIAALAGLELAETETRFELQAEQSVVGASPSGITEEFPLVGPRTLYGMTKLAAELVIAEYREAFGVCAVIDRCGVIAGPWQMGRVDQGVFSYWLLAHYLHRPLEYIGFGGTGKQVRDLLHVADLVALIDDQLSEPERWDGVTVNVGGGRDCSLSLRETTELCREIAGLVRSIDPVTGTENVSDIPP